MTRNQLRPLADAFSSRFRRPFQPKETPTKQNSTPPASNTRQRTVSHPKPQPHIKQGPTRSEEVAKFAKDEYLPWLEWKVEDMTPEDRTSFLEEFAESNSDVEHQAVLVYWAHHPDRAPDNLSCKKKAEKEKRGLDPKFDPLTSPENIAVFPRACHGDFMFGPRERAMEEGYEDVGPMGETMSPGEWMHGDEAPSALPDGEKQATKADSVIHPASDSSVHVNSSQSVVMTREESTVGPLENENEKEEDGAKVTDETHMEGRRRQVGLRWSGRLQRVWHSLKKVVQLDCLNVRR